MWIEKVGNENQQIGWKKETERANGSDHAPGTVFISIVWPTTAILKSQHRKINSISVKKIRFSLFSLTWRKSSSHFRAEQTKKKWKTTRKKIKWNIYNEICMRDN